MVKAVALCLAVAVFGCSKGKSATDLVRLAKALPKGATEDQVLQELGPPTTKTSSVKDGSTVTVWSYVPDKMDPLMIVVKFKDGKVVLSAAFGESLSKLL